MAVRTTTWILIGDASRARLFADGSPSRSFALVADFEHPSSRAHVSELVADAYGRKPVGGSRSAVNGRNRSFHGRPGVEPDTDPKDVEAMKFARDLAHELERAVDDHRFDELIVAAPPRFLGLLKETFCEKVRRRVILTLDKDLSLLSAPEITRRLRAVRAA